jgi:HEAT repeat protein
MNRKLLVILFFLAGTFFSIRPASALAQEVPSASFVDPQAAEKANAHEDEVYADAKEQLDDGDYNEAIKGFDEIIRIRGRRIDAAMYWKAYALNKNGNKAQALGVIGVLRKNYPNSTWLRDAGVLEQEMRGGGNPENISDEELKSLALSSLMNSDPERAVPLLDKVLNSPNSSPKLKDRALFVLSQSGSPKAQEILLSLAKANTQPSLQKRAVTYIGMNGRNRGVLKEIYNSTQDVSVKKAVFQGWLMSGDKEDVVALAKTEKNPELRKEAIRLLGMMGGRAELLEFYKNSPDVETREEAVGAMLMCGCGRELAEIVQTEKDPRVLGKAITTLGMVGGDESLAALTKIYSSQADVATKKKVVDALFLRGASKEMVALARKETNPELRRELIQKMSLMGSPEVTDYMMEILNK